MAVRARWSTFQSEILDSRFMNYIPFVVPTMTSFEGEGTEKLVPQE